MKFPALWSQIRDIMTVRERSFIGNERSSSRVEVLQLVPSAVLVDVDTKEWVPGGV